MSIKRQYYTSFTVEALHRDPKAPDHHDYRRDTHRHIFHIKVWFVGKYPDLRYEIDEYLYHNYNDSETKYYNFGTMTCEDLAQEIMNSFNIHQCEVSVDGEGVILTDSDVTFGIKGSLIFMPDEDVVEDGEDGSTEIELSEAQQAWEEAAVEEPANGQ